MEDLAGASALVTGASRGLGRVLAEALAREGVHLALAARDGAALEEVAASARARGVRAVALPTDLAVAAERDALARGAEAALGAIDLLVNNAGVESEGPFTSLTPEALAATIEVNLTAPVHLARLVLPGMLARRRGHLVNMASLAGKKGVSYAAIYSATKAGLVGWTSALRAELAGTGVSASAICPGFVTGVGMFARFGIPPPPLLGSCTPEQVTAAVLRAIRRDEPELLVNSRPIAPLLALAALAPRAADWIVERLGVQAFQRRKCGGAAADGDARKAG